MSDFRRRLPRYSAEGGLVISGKYELRPASVSGYVSP